MNITPFEKQVAIISALCEGNSIRSVERLTGSHRDTIMRLGVRVGKGCARLHDRMMHSLHVSRIEVDEAWSYVGKKQRKLTPADGADKGDQYVYLALDANSKAILSYRVGKRDRDNTEAFIADLRERVLGAPEINSDAYMHYPKAVGQSFGHDAHYGQIVKTYRGEPHKDAARRYSPGYVVKVDRARVSGDPRNISTSYVERSNLSLRMASRRFTRLTNGFSKKLENHIAAVSMYAAYYNLVRVHETIRTTPADALGIADGPWTIGDLVAAALQQLDRPEQVQRYGPFEVIQGGLTD